jgi:CRISPR-associated protein Cmr3
MFFYELTPIDTLFFRGNIPMEAGLLATESLFPPPPSVFAGAIRTLLGKEHYNDEIKITAILLKKDGKVYYPAPYSWFCDDNGKIYEAKNNRFEDDILTSVGGELPWLEKDDLKNVGGKWVSSYDIENAKLLPAFEFYESENRTGIALDYSRYTAKDGQLYSANHIRLKGEVSIIAGIDANLDDNGVLQLGGEKRLAKYKKFDFSIDATDNISLIPILATDENLKDVFATGKIIYISGWDLATKYHKSSQGYFPAGTVFNKPIKEIL